MRCLIILFLSLILFGFSGADTQRKQQRALNSIRQVNVNHARYNLEISVTETIEYCGGIRPNREKNQDIETPAALIRQKFYIKKGKINLFCSPVLFEAITDSSGKIALQIPTGSYIIVNENKKDSVCYRNLLLKYSRATREYSAIDSTCLKNWYEKPDIAFEIRVSERKSLSLNLTRPCPWKDIPCIQFTGPLRP